MIIVLGGKTFFRRFNYERGFGEARFCLRCREGGVGPVGSESRLCDACTGEVWGWGTAGSGRDEAPSVCGGAEHRRSGEGKLQPQERARLQNRLGELRPLDERLWAHESEGSAALR